MKPQRRLQAGCVVAGQQHRFLIHSVLLLAALARGTALFLEATIEDDDVAASGQLTFSASLLQAWGAAATTSPNGSDDDTALGLKSHEGVAAPAAIAMADVCADALRQVERVNDMQADELMRNGSVESACVQNVQRRLGDSGSLRDISNATLQKWCWNLDGRISLARESRFQLVEKHTDHAEGLETTRRSFCARFAAFVAGSLPEQALSDDQSLSLSRSSVSIQNRSEFLVPNSSQTVERGSPVPLQSQASNRSGFLAPYSGHSEEEDKDAGVLRLVQSTLKVSNGTSWSGICTELVSGLRSSQPSVTAKGRNNAKNDATLFLAFNTLDKSRIDSCAAKLKVLAILARADSSTGGAVQLRGALSALGLGATIDVSNVASTHKSDTALEALIDMPWAHDVCDDMAHGFLDSSPPVTPNGFCTLYANDLQALQVDKGVSTVDDDIAYLRNRANEITRRKVAKVFDKGATSSVNKSHVSLATKGDSTRVLDKGAGSSANKGHVSLATKGNSTRVIDHRAGSSANKGHVSLATQGTAVMQNISNGVSLVDSDNEDLMGADFWSQS